AGEGGPGRIRTSVGCAGRFTVCSLWPLGHRPLPSDRTPRASVKIPFRVMPTFDVVSEVDLQEVRNAVDQARREVATRFDFKGTGSTIELGEHEIQLQSATDDRLKALVQVLEEK